MCNVMLGMWDSNICIGIQHMEMKVIHVIIHVQEEQQHTNNHWNLQKTMLIEPHIKQTKLQIESIQMGKARQLGQMSNLR